MGEIKVRPEELRALAVKMQSTKELTENIKNNVVRATEDIRSGTENSVATNISSKMNLLNLKIGYLYNYLETHIQVLNQAADEFEQADSEQAQLTDSITHSRSSIQGNTSNVSIRDENGNIRWPYSQYIAPGRYTFGNEQDTMQCVGYVWARFEEITGIKPGFGSIGCAANLITEGYYQRDGRFYMEFDPSKIKVPAIVVTDTSPETTGHVVIIERVENGHIWYTDANHWGQKDGQNTCVSLNEFVNSLPANSGFLQLVN